MGKKKYYFIFIAAFVLLTIFIVMRCNTTNIPAVPGGGKVKLVDTNMNGATMLQKTSGSSGQTLIFIGHNTYGSDSGGLKFYDTHDATLKDTSIDVDVADFSFSSSNKMYIMGPYNTYSILTGGDPSTWTPTELLDGTNNYFGGSDMVLYGEKVYMVDPGGWSAPYNNRVYVINTVDDSVTTVTLGAEFQNEGFTSIGVYNDELYYTDTDDGDIYKSTDLNDIAGSLSPVTTTTESATGKIYFNNSMAYVLVGAGPSTVNEGVYMFDPSNPGAAATHFQNSGMISAQYMVFKDNDTAYVTHYSYGVYVFNPSSENSNYVIIPDTDPASVTGLQDIILDSSENMLYIAVNNYPNASKLMLVDMN